MQTKKHLVGTAGVRLLHNELGNGSVKQQIPTHSNRYRSVIATWPAEVAHIFYGGLLISLPLHCRLTWKGHWYFKVAVAVQSLSAVTRSQRAWKATGKE